MKNVAGYDLAKLFCGSRGRLGLIVRVALRLHPLPAEARSLAVPVAGPAEGRRLLRELRRSQLVPSAVDLRVAGELALLFEGAPRAVEAELDAARTLVGGEEADPWAEVSAFQAAARGRVPFDGLDGPEPPFVARRDTAYVPHEVDAGWPPARRARARRARPRGRARVKAELIADCVHCGFCLPTCPTYALWHEEMDSPRGRIQLMEGARSTARSSLNATVVEHFDRCLGCMACVTACPSGVQYDRLIEETRAEIEERTYRRPLGDRLLRSAVFAVFPHRKRLSRRAVARAARADGRPEAVPRARRARAAPPGRRLAARADPGRRAHRRPARRLRPERRVRRRQRGHGARARRRRLRRSRARGRRAAAARLHVHARPARGRASRPRAGRSPALAGHDHVVTNAAGCGSHLKDYGGCSPTTRLGRARGRVLGRVDVSELIAEPRAERRPLELRVAFQDSCHLRHAQGITAEPRALLAAIPGLVRLEPAEQELCCGSAGIYNLVQPEAATELGDRKAAAVLATGADALREREPGLPRPGHAALRRAGRPLPAFHPIELLDASIRGARPRRTARRRPADDR